MSMEINAIREQLEQLTRVVGAGAAAAPRPTALDVWPHYRSWLHAERRKSVAGISSMLRTVLAHPLASKPIADLTWMDLDDYKARRLETPSRRTGRRIALTTVDQEICYFLTLINWAAQPGRRVVTGVVHNPVSGYPLRSQRDRHKLRRTKIYSPAERWASLEWCRNPYLRAMILCVSNFLRPAEALQLEREQLEPQSDGRFIVRLRGDQTKNGRPRDIPLASDTMAAIKALPTWREGERFVFLNRRTGRPYTVSYMSKLFKNLREQIGLKGSRGRPAELYSYRHTAATRALEAGVSIATLADLMGHRDWKQLETSYAQIRHATKVRAVEAIELADSGGNGAALRAEFMRLHRDGGPARRERPRSVTVSGTVGEKGAAR